MILGTVEDDVGGIGFESFRAVCPEAMVCEESPCAADPGILETDERAVLGIPLPLLRVYVFSLLMALLGILLTRSVVSDVAVVGVVGVIVAILLGVGIDDGDVIVSLVGRFGAVLILGMT